MLVVGIDENGFGPRLGPLVVTASLVNVEGIECLLHSSLKESKKICASGRMAFCEELALSFYKLLYGYFPPTPLVFLSALLLTQQEECDSPFPHCILNFSLPHWSAIHDLDIVKARAYLQEIHIKLLEIKSIVLCPGRFNSRLECFSSKHHLEYSLFEELILYFRERYKSDEILFLCGRIGSTKNYSPFFYRFFLVAGSEEREGETCYYLPYRGEVRFITDGDEKYFPITLSSIIGKYIRELFVEQMNNFFRAHLPHLPYCSGYMNAITKEFIEETKELRKNLGIPDKCFFRVR